MALATRTLLGAIGEGLRRGLHLAAAASAVRWGRLVTAGRRTASTARAAVDGAGDVIAATFLPVIRSLRRNLSTTRNRLAGAAAIVLAPAVRVLGALGGALNGGWNRLPPRLRVPAASLVAATALVAVVVWVVLSQTLTEGARSVGLGSTAARGIVATLRGAATALVAIGARVADRAVTRPLLRARGALTVFGARLRRRTTTGIRSARTVLAPLTRRAGGVLAAVTGPIGKVDVALRRWAAPARSRLLTVAAAVARRIGRATGPLTRAVERAGGGIARRVRDVSGRLAPRVAIARDRLARWIRPIGRAASAGIDRLVARAARVTAPVRRRISVVTEPARRAWYRIPRRVRIPAASLTAAAALLVLAISMVLGQTWVVKDTRDRVDINVGDGSCDSDSAPGEQCTLRAAIQEANARGGPLSDTIHIEPGVYAIAIAPINENAANVGDFEILDQVTIAKAPGGLLGDVIIDGGNPLPSSPVIARGIDRLFEIHPGAGDVTFRNVTLRNGFSPEAGGAIQNWSLGKLTLDGVTIKDNFAEKAGGGLNHADLNDYEWTTEPPNLALLPHGRVEIRGSTFTGNGSGGGSGAAINNVSGGTITITGSTITLNPGAIMPNPLDPEEFVLVDPSDYPIAASAIANTAEWQKVGTLKISDSTVSLNASEGGGAGIANFGDSIVTIENSTITQNRTAAEGGGLYTEGGTVTVTGSTISKNQAANGGGLYSGGHVSQFGLRGTFSVTNSQVFENTAENGGGIYNDGDAQLLVTDTTFTKNHSSDHGAAISSSGRSNMTLTRVTVTENESNGEAGGVWTHSERQQTIVDSTFTKNKAGVPVIEEDGMLSDDVAGGGALHADGGPLTVLRTTFDGNSATEEGGALSLHNLGDIEVVDSTISNNRAFDGGGVENSAHGVTFLRVTVSGNRAGGAGGGIYNTSSGEFHILDSTIKGNSGVIGGGIANAPDNAIIMRGSLVANNTARLGFTEDGELDENAGRGGGIMSFADGDSLYENSTISGNKAAIAGGGLFHDADGELRLMHMTIWRNSAPAGGGIGVVESDFSPEIPPKTNAAVVLKNSIVGGSLQGGNCDWYVRSEGGNLETGATNTCFLAVTNNTAQSPIELGVRDRRGDPALWALADNGGPTLTHALQWGSLAIDSSEQPCSASDQRGVERPQNARCDAGAYEFVGDPPPFDDQPPETIYNFPEDGPVQDSIETMAFRFRGEDLITPPNELNFECRFLEMELTEEPEIVAPWDPIPPELMWNGCSSPWSVPLPEEGLFTFEVRATDRAGNTDPTPVSRIISGVGMEPPETLILEAPGLTPGATVPPTPATTPSTNSRAALFSFKAVSDFTPSQFAEYECRLDSRDPELWLECTNPMMYSDLTTGLHTFEVRALAGEVAGPDPTPARYTWRVGPDPDDPFATPINCDEANIVLTPSADGWADQVNPLENYLFETELDVRSDATVPDVGPITHQNAHAFFRFPLQSDAPACVLESATLRLYSSSHTEGRTLLAVPLAETWKESTLNWFTQPDPVPGAAGAPADAGEGYREFDVKAHIEAIFAGTMPNFGWVIQDQHESDPDGGDQTFTAREQPQDPPEITLPELELRFVQAAPPPQEARDETFVERVVECGEVITESTRLLADVTGCLGEGIAIGAPNIILDLNGFTVKSGLILELGEEDGLTPGIRSGYPNVLIENGTITNFGYGVLLGPNSYHTEVRGMALVRNALTGVQLFDADNGRIGPWVHGNTFDSNGETGLQLMSGTEGALIEDNQFFSNGMSIHVFDSHRNVIRNNTISGIILDPALDSDAGIVLENGSRLNTLEDNDVSDTGDAGIIIHQGSHGNIVRGGVLVRNGDAGVIVQDSDRIEIDGVLAHQQSDGGVVLSNSANSTVKNSDLRYNPAGVDASGTNKLVVENNNVSNSLQSGIELGDGVDMVIRNNVANSSGGSGISVEAGAFDSFGNAVGGAHIEGNTANQNAESGLSIAVAGHRVGNNVAHNNSGYGILAGEETTPGEPLDPNRNLDFGGNVASGNHSDGVLPGLPDAVQCLGVICGPGSAPPMTPPDLEAPVTMLLSTPPNETASETSVFTFTATDNTDLATALTFECRLDAPPDPAMPPEEPDLEPPDPNEPPELPEIPEGEFWVECVSPQTYLMVEPGVTHHFEVRAIDQAGNFDVTPETFSWIVTAGVEEDGSEECGPGETLGVHCLVPGLAPDTRITAAPGTLTTDLAGTRYDTTNRSATFRFVGSDNRTAGYNLVFECRTHYDEFNDGLLPADMPSEALLPFVPCDSPDLYTNLQYGGHIFEVRSIDLGGNRDAEPAYHTWWVYPPPPDTTPPDTEILSGPDPTTVQMSTTFIFTGSDNQTATEELDFQCRLDGAMDGGEPAWTACTSPHTVNGLAPGVQHILQVRAVDLAGNVDDVNGNVDNPSAPDPLDPRDGVPAAYVWNVGATPVSKTVFCGQKITQSIIVNNNLGDCLGHGLIVGAHGITIDLNGKTIDGKSIGAGILNNGFDSVTIRNGRLTDFDYGVMLNQGAALNIVEGVRGELNQDAAIALGHGTFPEDPALAPSDPVPGFQSGVDGTILRANTLVSNARGVWILNGAKDNVVRGNLIGASSEEAVWIERARQNLISGNDIQVASQAAVLLEGAVGNTVRDNTIVDVGTGVLVSATTSGTTGIESTGNLVEGNQITESAGPALRIFTSSGNQLIDNVATLSDAYAIELYLAHDNLVRGNDVSGNKGGVSLKNSTGNTIEGNDASNSDSTGIDLQSQSFNNLVLNNQSSNNVGGGIYIGDETPSGQGTLVQGNTTNSNKGMGIQATKPAHIFKGNLAFDNDSWGIYVGDPSNGRANIDGGGNIAQGNKGPLGVDLKPQQCYNITCVNGPGGGDEIPPNTSILEGPIQPESSESIAVFRFSGADNASPVTFECRFNSTLETGWHACSSPTTYSGLVNATYSFDVRAIDFSGNADATPASYTWAVLLGAFSASIDATPDRVTVETSATFEFSANRQTGVTFQCLLVPAGTDLTGLWDTAPACTSPKTYTGLSTGNHAFWVRATDPASTFDTRTYAWTIGPAPVAEVVNCGQILMHSTRLLNDLVDCGGHGLIVGAAGITIDLDGHVVDGMGLDAGILNNGHDDVTIKGGLISQFLYGVQLNPGTARNVVRDVRLEGNEEAGIALADADQGLDGNTIRNNSIVGNEIGIALYTGTRHAVIRDNTLAANQGEGGIYLEFASQNLIEGNQVSMSGGGGIFMIGGGGNVVSENLLKDNGGFGILAGEDLLASNNNLIQRNTIQGGQGGVMVAGDGNTVLNNSAVGTTGPGVVVELATNTVVQGNDFSGSAGGIAVGEATGTTIVANNASGTLGSGIEIGELSQDTVVRENTASGNGGDGIEVTESSVLNHGTLIENNTADANGGDGLYVEGAGHTIRGNVAQLNGGWGIYSVGGVDGGGNLAAGNMEPEQCFGVSCLIGIVPGAPETWIVTGPSDWDTLTPGIQSASRHASFTYMGSDNFSPITEIVFECRIDNDNPLAWEDCEYPAEYLNLSPGEHTLHIRAIDMLGQGQADPTPASFTWSYVPLPTGVAPTVILDVVPATPTFLFDAIFTFHANEPDVAFQCKVDANGYEPCGFESATFMNQGAYEWGLAENEVGPHIFSVRAIDFEGNVGEPTTFTWELMGVNIVFTDGPGFTPAVGGPQGDPATGGPSSSTSAQIVFEANVGDAMFWCRFDSMDPGGYFPCESPFRVGPAFAGDTAFPDPLLPGDHMLEVFGESETMGSAAELEPAVYEWEVVDPVDSLPPETAIERHPVAADLSSTIFEFSGTDDLTPEFLLTFECQVTTGTAAPNGAAWVECFSPFNLLDVYGYADPELLLTEHTFHVRAVDMFEPEFPDPTQPEFEGNVDPTPATHTWTPIADTRAPSATISGGPANGATIGPDSQPYTFFGMDNATPLLMLEFECAAFLTAAGIASAAWEPCETPYEINGLDPGAYTFAVRALDLAGNTGPAGTRLVTVAAAPVVTFVTGPAGRLDPISGEPDGASGTENAIFTFTSDQPGSTFECSADGSDFLPCGGASVPATGAAWVVENGEHEFAVRATNPQAIVGEEAVYEWFVELAPDIAEPNSTITSGPPNGTLLQVATFTFSGTDNRTPTLDLNFECALDSTTSWNSCTSPEQFSDLTRGTHTLRLRAIDAAGNIESELSWSVYTWIVAPPPVVTILSGPGVEQEESTERSATFTFVADTSPVTFHCWLDGKFNPSQPGNPSLPASCTSGQPYDGLGLGDHLFAVRAVDQFGNIGIWEDTEFRIMPSEARITSAPASGTTTTATFQFTSEPLDLGATFYCSLDDRPFGPCTDTPVAGSPGTYEKTYANLWPGEHTFQVQTLYTVLDWMGLPFEHDPIPAVHIWTVQDFTAPDTFIDFGPPATTLSPNAYIQVSSDDPTATVECTLTGPAGTEQADCEPGVVTELTELLPGAYTFTAVATDLSGNVDPTPATYGWTIGAPSGPPNTPVGDSVVVDLGDVTVTFFSVEAAGTTTADRLGAGPSLPEGFGGASSHIYDISTTAVYSEPVTLCINYDPADFDGATSLRLLHFDGELWLDVTTLHNPFSDPPRLCSNIVEGFSLFAIAIASSGMAPETSILSGPEGPLGPEGLPTSTSGSATFEFWTDQPNAITQCSLDGDPFFFCESPLTVSPLEEGDHEFLVQAINEFGWMDLTPAIYEWEVLGPDVTPPTTVITRGPPEGSSTPNFISIFEFTGTDDFTPALELEFECTVDGVALGGCETLEEIEVLTPGPHTLVVQAIDAAENIDPIGAVRNWTVVDMSGPDTEVLTGPEEETTETSATFTFEGFELLNDDPVNEFECALDQGEFAPCTTPHTIPGPLAGGAHVFHVRAVDPDGNRDISPAFYEWLIIGPPDTTPPDTFIVVYPDPANSGPDVTFGFASDEPVESFECSWGHGTPPASPTTWEECEVVWFLEALDSGQHWLWVRALDAAEIPNVDPTPAGLDRGFGPNDINPFVWVTTGEPNTFIDAGPTDPTGSYTATWTFHSDQPGATFQCSVNGSPYVSCASGYQAGPFLPGPAGEPEEHEFEVRAVNQFRNADGEQVVDMSPAIDTWTVQDVTPPDTVFLGAAEIGPEQFVEPGLRFTFRGVDDLGSSFELEFECAFTNTTESAPEAWEECGEPWAGDSFFHEIAYADLTAGAYTFQVRARDLAENHDPTPAPEPAHEFIVEAEPETTILTVTPDMGVDLETTGTSVTFTFSGSGASFLCALDSTTFSPCPGGVAGEAAYTDVPYGEHLFQVMAVGEFGTPDETPAEFEWVSGTDVAPDVTITAAPPATGGTATTGTIEFSSTDPTAAFLCVLDAGPELPCSSETGFPYADLLAGEQNLHTFEVTATRADLLPSVTLLVATHEWVITDDAAPTTMLLAPLPTNPSGNEVAFFFTGADNGTIPANLEFECRLDGIDPWVGCSSPHTVPDLTGGAHTFEVRATDEMPLTGAAATHTWDVIAPPLTVITNTTPLGEVPEGETSQSAIGELSFVDQPGSTYECRLDPFDEFTPPFASCESPFGYDLSNGTHVFEVRARTLPLNGQATLESPPAEYEWTIDAADTTDPQTTIQLAPADPTASTSATFIFKGTDNLTALIDMTYECSLDGAAFAACASGDVYPGLEVSDHTFAVRAIDNAPVPNADESPATYAWTIEAAGTNNTLEGTNVEVELGGATVTFAEVTADGVTTISVLTTGSPPALPNGYFTADALYFDISTTATFLGDVTVCLPYTGLTDPHVLHFEGGVWTDVTLELQGDQVCGVVSSLSPFAVVEVSADVAPQTTIIQAPPATTIQSTSGGANVQFQFTSTLALSEFECKLDGAEWSSCDTPYAFEALFGEHTLDVRAVSQSAVIDVSPDSHTWTVLARPVVTIDSGPADQDPIEPGVQTDAQTATFEFSSTDPDATFECRLTGEATGSTWAPCLSGQQYDSLGIDQEYTFEVQAISAAGHASFVPVQYEWEIVDMSAPVVTIVDGPSGTIDQTTATFTFSADEPVTFECSLDGAPFGLCSTPIGYTGFGQGTHTFTVQATDLSEDENLSEPVTRTWTVADLTGPSLSIDAKPTATTSDTAPTFAFSATDNWPGAISFACSLDGATPTACTSPLGYVGLSAASHTFQVTATDTAGNDSSATWTWTVEDVNAPEADITNVTSGSITFEFTGSDDHTASADLDFECRIDSGSWSACTSPKTYTTAQLTAMTPGDHTFSVRAIDEAGNVGPADSRVFTVADTAAPNTSITGQPQATTTNTTASFTFTGSDDGTAPASLTYECALNGAPFTGCTSPKEYTGLAVGPHSFQVRATDAAGNTDESPATYSWTVLDSISPGTTITGQPDASTPETGASFSFTGTDDVTAGANLTFQCSLNGSAFAACVSPTAYSGLGAGSHTFQVRAIDAAGNVDASPAAYSWTVLDTTAPNTSITGQPQPTTTNTTASFTFTGSDNVTLPAGLTFECALDGAAFEACTVPKEYAGLAVTTHTFAVRATDAAGNTDESPAGYSWTIQEPAPAPDTTAPETSITAQPPATTIETSATFGFAGTDAVTPAGSLTFECQLDTAAYAACTSPTSYTNLSVANHTFRVRARDAAGNTDQSPASYSWTVQSSTVNCGLPQTLTSSADAWIDASSPTSNKGSDSILKVMSKNGGNLRALVRFNLPTMPSGCSVESATLRIYAKSGAGGRTIQVHQLAGTWTEGGVTWANQPATTGAPVSTISGTGYREWNVAGYVQAMYTGTNNGFLVRDATENQDAEQQFHSREESTNRPQLVLTFGTGAPPPPPGGSDTTPPDTTITGSPATATSSTSAGFTFSGVDDTTAGGSLTFECQLDVPQTSSWTACTNPHNLSNLAVGSHTFRVRAKDAAGNVDPQPAVHTWTIDQTAPETVITNGPLASTTSTTASFQFTSPETGVTFACSLDTAPFAACTSPKDYSGLAVGSHTFRVQATDAAGNLDPTAANYPWTIQPGGTPVNCGSAQTISANADAWIEQKSPSSNKGSDSALKVMSKNGNSNLRALVRFALPTAPTGCVIDTASLRLYAGSASSGTRTLQALRLNGTWTESGVTWQNQPATTGTAATTTSGTGYRQWNVAAIVQAMYSAGASHGFLIRDATEGQDAEQQFFSREKGENPPQLVIGFKPDSSGSGAGPVAASCGERCQTAGVSAATALTLSALEPVMLAGTVSILAVFSVVLSSTYLGRRPLRLVRVRVRAGVRAT